MQIFLLWFLLRSSSFLVAAKASSVQGFANLERRLPVWPLSGPPGLWLQLQRPDHSTLPAFPRSAKLLSLLGINPAVGLVLVSSLAGLAFLYIFERLPRLDLLDDRASSATLFLLIFPISMVFFIPYTEGMFFLFAARCFYSAQRQRWWLAGPFGMLATLTKLAGVVLAVALVFELWGEDPANRRWSWRTLQKWASILPIPVTVVIWTAIRNQVVNQVKFDPAHVQQWFLSLFVSPSADMTGSRMTILWPWHLFAEAVERAIHDPVARLHVALTLGGYLAMVVLFVLTWRFLRPSYRVYSLLLILYSSLIFCFYYGTLLLMSAFRHSYTDFPIFIELQKLDVPKGGRLLAAAVCLLLFIFMMYAFSMEGWVP